MCEQISQKWRWYKGGVNVNLAPFVRKVESAIYAINLYPVYPIVQQQGLRKQQILI